MQEMDQSDTAKLPEVQAHTRNYLLDPLVSARMDQAAKATIERVGILKNSQGNIRLLNQPSSTIRRYPPPSSDFTGREDILEMMQRYFFSHLSSSRRIFVLHGLGGAGKTQLALKFVQLHKKRFWDIFYIDATTHNTISTGLVQIAKAAQVGETKEDGLAWLVSQEQSWLLLFNNADDPELNLSLYFPACAHGDVLITTRNKQMIVHTRGTGSHCRVSEMLPDDAKELLLKIYGSDEDEDPGEAVTTLVERLGLFALAIVQAAAYMRATQCKATDYLIYLQSSREQLLRARLVNQTDAYGLSVYATWEISYKKINSRAAQLLHILSFMHHEGIEERFFEISSAVTSYKPEIPLSEEQGATKDAIFEFLSLFRTASHGWNLLAFRNLTEDLSAFSLLDYNPRTRTHSMHPLVQEWCRSTAPNAMAMRECAAWVLALCVNSRFGLEDYAFRRRLLPHLLALDTNTTQMVPELAQKLCLVYDEAGLTKEDEALSKIALQGSRDMFGNEHSTTLTCMHNLASAFRRQGKSEEAMTLLTEVIESSKRVLGDEHPDTLTSMHSLAMTYRAQERWQESEAMFLDVIETKRRVGGIDDSRTLKSMEVLASTYAEQGRLLEAELLYDEVLEKMSKVLGKEHPHTLTAMHNLAATYGGQGKLVEAELLMKETVALKTKVPGELHTHTLNSVRILEAIHQRVRLELSPSLLLT
ncbi:TPR-like protein [Ceratobasidium sp. AG-I]|nr:TPR-like protein [Ceratobasidium sp. AG-I]